MRDSSRILPSNYTVMRRNNHLPIKLWTMYCEEAALLTAPHSEAKKYASGIILEFWGRVTPGILQLLSHSKVVSTINTKPIPSSVNI